MKISLIIISIITSILVDAQSPIVTKLPQIDTTYNQKLTGAFFVENKQFIGSQYVQDKWNAGRILLTTGKLVECEALKYNGLFDELIWLNLHNSGIFVVDKLGITDFWITDSRSKQKHFQNISFYQDSTKNIFAELVFDGNLKLYVHRKISIQGFQFLIVNDIKRKYDILKSTPVYYIRLPKGEYKVINKLNRKIIVASMLPYQNEINRILKLSRLNLKNEIDFIKFIEQLNLIVKE